MIRSSHKSLQCRPGHVQVLGNLDAVQAHLKTQKTLACANGPLCIGCRLGIALVYNVYSRGSLSDALPVRPPKDALHSSNRSLQPSKPTRRLLAMPIVSSVSRPRM